ncbi:hypothetical protein P3S68_013866 [Capsicum galapagoense]
MFFFSLKEGVIKLAPTYEYKINTDKFVGETPREMDKKRSPSCASDHKPASSMFVEEVEIFFMTESSKEFSVLTLPLDIED